MAGAGGGYDCGGHQIISAFERDLLGWINCKSPEENSRLQLADLYSSSDCFVLPLSNELQNRRLYLTNHQSIGYFDQPRNGGVNSQFDMGLLRTKGLLIHLADGYRLDVVAADNSLDLANDDSTYAGDMIDGENMSQITPWTRPSINGYNQYPQQAKPSWFALDEIEALQDSLSSISFLFIKDIRSRPIIREDSWMGIESADTRFNSTLSIRNEARLTVDTHIILEEGLSVEKGSIVHITKSGRIMLPGGSKLTMHPGSELYVDGKLQIQGAMDISETAHIIESSTGDITYPD